MFSKTRTVQYKHHMIKMNVRGEENGFQKMTGNRSNQGILELSIFYKSFNHEESSTFSIN